MENLSIQKTLFKVGDFVSWKKVKSLELSPSFQRRSVWNSGAKSFLIDTIIRKFPVPIIFIRDVRTDLSSLEPKREIIDGQQRIRTVLSFISPDLLEDFNPSRDSFTIKKTHNSEYGEKRFYELPADIQRGILEYEFTVHVLPSWVDDRQVLQIFRRMNSINYKVNPQELRNAEFFGDFKSSVYFLSGQFLGLWREWKVFSEDDIARMNEVEFTSEVVMLMFEKEFRSKSQSKISGFYRKYESEFPERDEVEKRFSQVMMAIEEKIGKDIVRLNLNKKGLFFSLFALFYDCLFGVKSSLVKKEPHEISSSQIDKIKLAAKRILEKEAPVKVLESTTRRSSNPKERAIIFEYMKTLKIRD